MPGQYASNAWAEIIANAAVSPLGISALVILVIGFVDLALIRRDDKIAARLITVALLLIFCGGLLTAAFYKVNPTVAQPESPGDTSATATAPRTSPTPTAPSARTGG